MATEDPVPIDEVKLNEVKDRLADKADSVPRTLSIGPIEGVEYPIKVIYCGVCTLPVEYCQYYPTHEKCKEWLENNLPDEFNKMNLDQDGSKIKGKQSKRGGKGLIKVKKKVGNQKIELFRSTRGKKKFVTVIRGLSTFEVDLKDAAKLFASKFACGSSVTGEDEIVVQGDVKDYLIDVLQVNWPDIEDEMIEDLGDKKY